MDPRELRRIFQAVPIRKYCSFHVYNWTWYLLHWFCILTREVLCVVLKILFCSLIWFVALRLCSLEFYRVIILTVVSYIHSVRYNLTSVHKINSKIIVFHPIPRFTRRPTQILRTLPFLMINNNNCASIGSDAVDARCSDRRNGNIEFGWCSTFVDGENGYTVRARKLHA